MDTGITIHEELKKDMVFLPKQLVCEACELEIDIEAEVEKRFVILKGIFP